MQKAQCGYGFYRKIETLGLFEKLEADERRIPNGNHAGR